MIRVDFSIKIKTLLLLLLHLGNDLYIKGSIKSGARHFLQMIRSFAPAGLKYEEYLDDRSSSNYDPDKIFFTVCHEPESDGKIVIEMGKGQDMFHIVRMGFENVDFYGHRVSYKSEDECLYLMQALQEQPLLSVVVPKLWVVPLTDIVAWKKAVRELCRRSDIEKVVECATRIDCEMLKAILEGTEVRIVENSSPIQITASFGNVSSMQTIFVKSNYALGQITAYYRGEQLSFPLTDEQFELESPPRQFVIINENNTVRAFEVADGHRGMLFTEQDVNGKYFKYIIGKSSVKINEFPLETIIHELRRVKKVQPNSEITYNNDILSFVEITV